MSLPRPISRLDSSMLFTKRSQKDMPLPGMDIILEGIYALVLGILPLESGSTPHDSVCVHSARYAIKSNDTYTHTHIWEKNNMYIYIWYIWYINTYTFMCAHALGGMMSLRAARFGCRCTKVHTSPILCTAFCSNQGLSGAADRVSINFWNRSEGHDRNVFGKGLSAKAIDDLQCLVCACVPWTIPQTCHFPPKTVAQDTLL